MSALSQGLSSFITPYINSPRLSSFMISTWEAVHRGWPMGVDFPSMTGLSTDSKIRRRFLVWGVASGESFWGRDSNSPRSRNMDVKAATLAWVTTVCLGAFVSWISLEPKDPRAMTANWGNASAKSSPFRRASSLEMHPGWPCESSGTGGMTPGLLTGVCTGGVTAASGATDRALT